MKDKDYKLPNIYEEYLSYYQKSWQANNKRITHIRRVLFAFYAYLKKSKLNLSSITIEKIDSFFAEFNAGFAPATCQQYLYYLRGFLRYLYHESRVVKKDFSPLIVGAPVFAHSKPPKFLRPHEIQKLFDSLDLSTPKGLRTYAMLKLAHSLGLRPKEISRLTLDDIEFSKGEISIEGRKTDNPIKLPIPEDVIKAIAMYIIGGRQKTMYRALFLRLMIPHQPVTANSISSYIRLVMHKINLNSSAYWLRHTYGQNLLESGASIYEIKEMMGHDSIESTKQYLHIHIKLMLEVLFDE